MWLTARFLPTSVFSLRPALATSSGAQTLLVPTPFAIKMALLNGAIRQYGVDAGATYWSAIRDCDIALNVPERLIVNKTFIKIQRPTRFNRRVEAEYQAVMEAGLYPFNPTIAFREFVQFDGELGIALRFDQTRTNSSDNGMQWLKQINYLGKRGGFMQLQAQPQLCDALDDGWTMITQSPEQFNVRGTLQVLDDCGAKLTWDHVNIYSGKAIKVNNDERVLRSIVLPYRLARSSYRYSFYERIEED